MAADATMDSCGSPEVSDSRKRPLDGEVENGEVKRSHFSSASEATYHFKVLIPSMVAGAIIGKGGETIAQLQKDTGARVKMSKSHDFYPGTSERACLITGSVEAIMVVLDFVMEKIKEKPELVKPFPDAADAKMPQDRDKQVKILVPNSTAGMIIGKGGNYIKQMKEASGSYVQISQKAKDISLQERCITVVGEKENNKKACLMILQKVVDDPQSGSCPNVSYADVSGPVANYNPTGSPYAAPTAPEGHALGGVGSLLVNGAAGGALSALSLTLSLAPPGTASISPLTLQQLDHIKVYLRNAGHSESVVGEVGAALALLAKHQVVGLGLPPAPPAPLAAAPAPLSYFPLTAEQTGVFGPIGQFSLAFDAFRSPAVAPISLASGFALGSVGSAAPASLVPLSKSPTPADLGAKDTLNKDIPEVIVGAILGPGGRSLIDIQHRSGANIQISKKGTFAPGTRNRIVTICGSPAAIAYASNLIDEKIQEEELKRTRHNAITGLIQ